MTSQNGRDLTIFEQCDVQSQFHPERKKEKLFRAFQNFMNNISSATCRKYREAVVDFFKVPKVNDPEKVKLADVIFYREHLIEKNLSPYTIALRISALRSL